MISLLLLPDLDATLGGESEGISFSTLLSY
jgi:hypothetical protein